MGINSIQIQFMYMYLIKNLLQINDTNLEFQDFIDFRTMYDVQDYIHVRKKNTSHDMTAWSIVYQEVTE